MALWLAAGGNGWVYEGSPSVQRIKYKSEARVLLVGSGADEQCAGYGRYKTKYRNGRCAFLISNVICWCQTCRGTLLILGHWGVCYIAGPQFC